MKGTNSSDHQINFIKKNIGFYEFRNLAEFFLRNYKTHHKEKLHGKYIRETDGVEIVNDRYFQAWYPETPDCRVYCSKIEGEKISIVIKGPYLAAKKLEEILKEKEHNSLN
jgi:hypothetical protein